MRFASNKSRVVWALLVAGAFMLITTMQLTSAAAKPPDGKGGGKGGGGKGGTPPAAVTDLTVTGVTHDSITIEWTASGNSGTEGTAAAYEIRYLIDSPVAISDANWDFANLAYTEPAPQPSGSAESFTIRRLSGDRVYDIGVRVISDGGSASDLSNPVAAVTSVTPAGAWDFNLSTQADIGDSELADFAFDPSDGQPSVVYRDAATNALWFAHFNGVSWDTDLILPNSGYANVRLEYDPMGRAAIATHGTGIQGVLYGVLDGSGWTIESITSSQIDGGVLDLTHDAAGNPHVLFDLFITTGKGKNRTSFGELNFAIRGGSGWQLEPLVSSDAFLKASMTLDAGDNAVVVYTVPGSDDSISGTLKLRQRLAPGTWTLDTIHDFTDGAKAAQLSMAIDPITGWPLIAFRHFTSAAKTLQVARYNGIAWSLELVDAVADAINDPHVRFDSAGVAYIAYKDHGVDRGAPDAVLLAIDNGASWDIEVVTDEDPFLAGSGVANLRFDGFGQVTISFLIEHTDGSSPADELFVASKASSP